MFTTTDLPNWLSCHILPHLIASNLSLKAALAIILHFLLLEEIYVSIVIRSISRNLAFLMKDVLSILYIYHAILEVGYCLPFSRKIMLKAFPEQYAGDYIKW